MSCRRLLSGDATQCPDDGAGVELVDKLPSGSRLDKYRIERVLGEGGMGFVYEATHAELNRRAAIKMLRPELARQAHVMTRFQNEAIAVNTIAHQNIVNVYDYGTGADGSAYFVMDLLEGEPLDELMHRCRPLPIPLLLHIFSQIARALAAAHAKRIVHRDLKPANVFITAREDNPYFVKLLDFGVAQLRGAGAVEGLTLTGAVLGTPQYMSPEQISGHTVDARCDLWALGVMLYRGATGQPPFSGIELAQIADQILHRPIPPASEICKLPDALSRLIASCLERRLDDRCPSIDAVIAGLEQVRREVGLDGDALIAAVHAEAGPVSGWRDTRRERTNDVVAGSLPQHQGALRPGDPIPADAQQPAELRIGRYVALAAALLALAGGVYAMLGHRSHTPEPSKPPVSAPIPAPTTRDTVAAGDIAGARALAADDLRARLGGESLQQRGFVVEALESARVPAAAKLLQEALHGPPGVQDRAARALGELGLPDAAIKLGAALSGAPEQVKVELAAAMYRLGNKDARAILAKALDGGGTALGKMIAAEAMALAGDPAGRAVLAQALIDVRAGNELWYRAARGLLELGDGNARKQLEAERSQRDPARIVAAAELLARAGDASSQEVLARVAADDDHAAQSAAALALARLGDKRALDWVARGLASTDPELRRRAVAICGPLAASAAAHRASIAKLATEDPDLRVRLTAEVVLLSL